MQEANKMVDQKWRANVDSIKLKRHKMAQTTRKIYAYKSGQQLQFLQKKKNAASLSLQPRADWREPDQATTANLDEATATTSTPHLARR